MTDDEEDAWCVEQREAVIGYLSGEGLKYGSVGEWPAWQAVPYVSVWAIESLKRPGFVGWWAVSGDLPTDYCSSENCKHPRAALEKIALSWRDAIANSIAGAERIGGTSLPISLKSLLSQKSAFLMELVNDPDLWSD